MSDVREDALRLTETGEKVLVLMKSTQRYVGHIDKLLHGGIELLERTPEGRVRRTLWYVDIDSMAAFDEPEKEDPVIEDPLAALSDNLRARAAEMDEMSEAEKLARARTSNASSA